MGSISGSILCSTILDAPRNLCLKFIKIGSVTAEILLTLSFCGGGGVCKVIFVSNPTVVLRLGWGFDNFDFWESGSVAHLECGS